MSRKDDLEQSIRESYDIVRQYKAIIRTSDRPEEKLRARRVIDAQWILVEGYLAEYRPLVEDVLPGEIAQIAAQASALGASSKSVTQALSLNSPEHSVVGPKQEADLRHTGERSVRPGTPKYYIYVSDAKVDMFYAQIAHHEMEKIATRLGIDLESVGTSFADKSTEERRYLKLQIVVNFIENNFDVGTVDKPKNYVKGVIPMRWGPFYLGTVQPGLGNSGLVWFGGFTPTTVVGLGGSSKHIIGGHYGDSYVRDSSLPSILDAIAQMKDDKIKESEISDRDRDSCLDLIDWHTRTMPGPVQRLEFLAKRLLEGEGLHAGLPTREDFHDPEMRRGTHLLLGTPIYVAQAD